MKLTLHWQLSLATAVFCGSFASTPASDCGNEIASLNNSASLRAISKDRFVFSKREVDRLRQENNWTIDQLMTALLPLAKAHAQDPAISHYPVGEVALGASGRIYLGVNLEFSGLPLFNTIHGEQFLVVLAHAMGEKSLKKILLPAAPCGHCRQFMNEMDQADQMEVSVVGGPARFLNDWLPDAFGPKELGQSSGLLAQPSTPLKLNELSFDPLVQEALIAAKKSYAPYSQNFAGVALEVVSGEILSGSAMENAAFNPGLPPMQSALVILKARGYSLESLRSVALVELADKKVSYRSATLALIDSIEKLTGQKLKLIYKTASAADSI